MYITCCCHAVQLVLLEADAGAEVAAREAMRLASASCWWLLLLMVLLLVVLVALLPTPPPAPRLSMAVGCCCCCCRCSSTIVRRPAESVCRSLLLSSPWCGRASPRGWAASTAWGDVGGLCCEGICTVQRCSTSSCSEECLEKFCISTIKSNKSISKRQTSVLYSVIQVRVSLWLSIMQWKPLYREKKC